MVFARTAMSSLSAFISAAACCLICVYLLGSCLLCGLLAHWPVHWFCPNLNYLLKLYSGQQFRCCLGYCFNVCNGRKHKGCSGLLWRALLTDGPAFMNLCPCQVHVKASFTIAVYQQWLSRLAIFRWLILCATWTDIWSNILDVSVNVFFRWQ